MTIDQLQEELGGLAMDYRNNPDPAHRSKVKAAYADVVKKLIATGGWNEIPPLEDQLPDSDMPSDYFAYWV